MNKDIKSGAELAFSICEEIAIKERQRINKNRRECKTNGYELTPLDVIERARRKFLHEYIKIMKR